jgi:hypothetical protein
MLVVGSGRCLMSVVGKLEVKVSRFGRDENRAVEFDIRGVVCLILLWLFSLKKSRRLVPNTQACLVFHCRCSPGMSLRCSCGGKTEPTGKFDVGLLFWVLRCRFGKG